MVLLLEPLAEPAERWIAALSPLLPDVRIRVWPDAGRLEDIEVAAVARLPDGALSRMPKLRLICSLLAGQDFLLSDPHLPDVPIARTDNEEGNGSFTDTVLVHVLRHYCQLPLYAAQQRDKVWARLPQKPKAGTQVGFLGLGLFGQAAARRVIDEGFKVSGWSRTPKTIPGLTSHVGEDGLAHMLAGTDILVNLLQLTPQTHGLLNRRTLAHLPKGASLINLARGAHLPEADLYWALDNGVLSSATLDVLETEPPPPLARVWSDPKITLTPHIARLVFDVAGACRRIAEAVQATRAGRMPAAIVDRNRGY